MKVKPILPTSESTGWRINRSEFRRGDKVRPLIKVAGSSAYISRKQSLHVGRRRGVKRWDKIPQEIGTIQEVVCHPWNKGIVTLHVSFGDFLVKMQPRDIEKVEA